MVTEASQRPGRKHALTMTQEEIQQQHRRAERPDGYHRLTPEQREHRALEAQQIREAAAQVWPPHGRSPKPSKG